jgi:hypothetical protein
MTIVFNAAAKQKGFPSLNDCLHAGCNLNLEILAVLIRFWSWKVAFTGDIEKAFLQIEIKESDRDAFFMDTGYFN